MQLVRSENAKRRRISTFPAGRSTEPILETSGLSVFLSWWEGWGEEDTFSRWNHVRGWMKSFHDILHNWFASSHPILQLETPR